MLGIVAQRSPPRSVINLISIHKNYDVLLTKFPYITGFVVLLSAARITSEMCDLTKIYLHWRGIHFRHSSTRHPLFGTNTIILSRWNHSVISRGLDQDRNAWLAFWTKSSEWSHLHQGNVPIWCFCLKSWMVRNLRSSTWPLTRQNWGRMNSLEKYFRISLLKWKQMQWLGRRDARPLGPKLLFSCSFRQKIAK